MEKATAVADAVIFGGGVAGLWLLHRLRQAGFSVFLFESGTLGGGQTLRSQGIIHGGMKYALEGVLTKEAQSLFTMPERWKACLSGKGEIDLSNVPILSPQQYLWSPNKITSKLTGFLASSTLNSKVISVPKEDHPPVFQHPKFGGEIFALDEIVIDVPSLIRELFKANQDAIFKIEPLNGEELVLSNDGRLQAAKVYMAGKSIEINAQQFIFTAGVGNELIIKKLKETNLAMQRRPLHMVMLKVPSSYSLYAHCLGLSNRPRVTITTHQMQNGETIWYVGGAISEEGVERSSEEQIRATKKELDSLFPWLNFNNADFASFTIDRAEPEQKNRLKPESSFIKVINNMVIAWPTKLVLAPKLAQDVLQHLQEIHLSPQLCDLRELRAWPIPPLAKPVWEDAFCKDEK